MGASRHKEGAAGKEEGGGTKTLPLPVPAEDFQRANDIREGGESANFLEDVCPHIHIHVIRPLSARGAASASLSAFRASVSPSADRELLHPQVRESD